mmetsp:Transcript_46678/g.141630  ORF Transcript_46678/g.141630 Transcript_46678/m.141630 type:complete len:300 (+) Transcript_46678:250-1149(+)
MALRASGGQLEGPNVSEPEGSNLSRVLLVLGHVRSDRAHLLLGYKRHFWDVWYINPSGNTTNAFTCARWEDMNCLSDVMTAFPFVLDNATRQLQRWAGGRRRDRPDGVLYLHFDFWINPSLFSQHSLDLRKVWRLRAGLTRGGRHQRIIPNQCKKGQALMEDSHRRGGWFFPGSRHRTAGLAAVDSAVSANMNASLHWTSDELCYGWVDLMYIPQAGWQSFVELARGPFNSVWHEVAVPTILAMLVRSGQVAGEEVVDCWGSCCTNTVDPAILKQNMCGHQMDLRDETLQAGLVEMLSA